MKTLRCLLTQAVLMNWVIIAARREGSGSATIQVATHPDAALNLEIMAATLGDRLGSVYALNYERVL